MIGFGVPAGAMKPLTMSAGRSWPVASIMVGTSGSADERLLLNMPSARRLAAADIGHRRRQRRHRDRHMAAERGCGRRAAAVERHVRDVDVERQLEQFAGQMRGRAAAGRGVAVLAGACLRQRDQFVDALGRDRRMHHQHMRRRAHQRDRLEVLVGIVGDFRIEADVGDDVAGGGEDRIAVRRGARGRAPWRCCRRRPACSRCRTTGRGFRVSLAATSRAVVSPCPPGPVVTITRTGRVG